MTKDKISSELNKILPNVKKFVIKTKKENKPNKKILKGNKFRKFIYLNSLLTSASGKPYTKEVEDWNFLKWPIVNAIKNSNDFKKLLNLISKTFPKLTSEDLTSFFEKVVRLYLKDDIYGLHSRKNLVNAFIKQLNDEPLLHKVDFEITGILLKPKFVKINKTTILQKITKKDLEIPIPEEAFFSDRKYSHSALAKLHVEYFAKKDYINMHKWEMILAILRLYKVADVAYNSVSETSESTKDWIHYGEPSIFRNHHFIFAGFITDKDAKKLPKFWKGIEKFIPDSFKVPFTQRDWITIAYQRYLEAMSHPGDEEMRIAYGISALEAIFLTEKTELKYRLRMRVSQILGILGLDPQQVYKDVGEAYDVRSIFDHGEKLNEKHIFRLRDLYNAKDERILTMIILDYVRLSIIAVIMLQISKNNLITLIDNSWVSKEDLIKLTKILNQAKKLLELNSYKPNFSLSPFNMSDFSYIK